MLTDEEIKPICKRYARVFFRQAARTRHIGPECILEELFNEAFIIAKGCHHIRTVPTAIKWGLIKYIGLPCSTKAKNPNKDKRKLSSLRETADKITAEQIVERKEEYKLLSDAVGRLSDKEQYIIEYYFYRGLKLKEIAKIYGQSVQWISYLLKETLKKLEREINGTAS